MSCSWLRNAQASEVPSMQTISAHADLQSLRDKTCFHFLKKAKRVVLTGQEGAGSTIPEATVYTCMRWDATAGRARERETDSSDEKRGRLKSRQKNESGPTVTRPKTPNFIWRTDNTISSHSWSSIRQRWMSRSYLTGVNRRTGETHTCIPLDYAIVLRYTNQTCGAIEGLHLEVLTV